MTKTKKTLCIVGAAVLLPVLVIVIVVNVTLSKIKRIDGYEPDVDIKVEYTGLRPGEKLFEELLMSEEGMRKTPNKLIYIGSPIEFNEENFIEELEALRAAENKSFDEIRAKLREIVPTYTG